MERLVPVTHIQKTVIYNYHHPPWRVTAQLVLALSTSLSYVLKGRPLFLEILVPTIYNKQKLITYYVFIREIQLFLNLPCVS